MSLNVQNLLPQNTAGASPPTVVEAESEQPMTAMQRMRSRVINQMPERYQERARQNLGLSAPAATQPNAVETAATRAVADTASVANQASTAVSHAAPVDPKVMALMSAVDESLRPQVAFDALNLLIANAPEEASRNALATAFANHALDVHVSGGAVTSELEKMGLATKAYQQFTSHLDEVVAQVAKQVV